MIKVQFGSEPGQFMRYLKSEWKQDAHSLYLHRLLQNLSFSAF